MLPDRQKIRQNLRRMELIGQTIPDRYAGILCQILDDFLTKAAIFNAVKHTAEYPCGVRNALLLADLGTGRIQISNLHTEIMRCNFKAATGTSTGLFKDQRNILAAQRVVRDTRFFLCLQIRREIEKTLNFLRGKIKQL